MAAPVSTDPAMPGEAPVPKDTATPGATKGGKRSAWMAHVKATMRAHKGKPLSAVLKMAKKTYKKRGGASLTPAPVGGRRRGTRKSSKRSRKH